MSGMLNSGMQGMGSMGGGGLDPQMLMQMLGQQQKDPFQKPMPGDAMLGPGGMAPPPMPQPNNMAQGMGGPQAPGMEGISTDFQDTQPGLPNLPDSFQGFGYGQFAPKETQGMGGAGPQGSIRQNMIMELMQQILPQLMGGGMGGGQMGGMGGF